MLMTSTLRRPLCSRGRRRSRAMSHSSQLSLTYKRARAVVTPCRCRNCRSIVLRAWLTRPYCLSLGKALSHTSSESPGGQGHVDLLGLWDTPEPLLDPIWGLRLRKPRERLGCRVQRRLESATVSADLEMLVRPGTICLGE